MWLVYFGDMWPCNAASGWNCLLKKICINRCGSLKQKLTVTDALTLDLCFTIVFIQKNILTLYWNWSQNKPLSKYFVPLVILIGPLLECLYDLQY